MRGVAARLLRLTPQKLLARTPAAPTEFGHLLETFVVAELLKQTSWTDGIGGLGHWRTRDGASGRTDEPLFVDDHSRRRAPYQRWLVVGARGADQPAATDRWASSPTPLAFRGTHPERSLLLPAFRGT
jgi:hypothetical protein